MDGLTRLIPAGRFEAPRGALAGSGPWFLGAAAAQSIIQRAAARSTDIVIDYEHQTLLTEQNGEPAPASGWIDRTSLQWRDDGLYGRIDWKARAQAAIDADEYRYLSPVFPYDPKTGDVLDLLHVGLTNNPAIDTAIPALAAARLGSGTYDPTREEDTVDREKLIKLLGLSADATDEQIAEAINKLKTTADGAEQAIAAAQDAATVAATKAAKPDMGQFVPLAVFQEQGTQLAALRAGSDVAQLDALIEEGLKDGRIPGKATADWLREQGVAACKAHLKDAPPVAALRGSQTTDTRKPDDADKKGDKLSEPELAVCRATGISPADYRKHNPVEE
ncbi:phage protease [Pseudomonas segetis]|uniref:phage protease n=1 Tax=Pseudomonas segetis TaxID=298908 RepID=UPI001595E85D|nr:phage protease [Pseudomonas segetis]